MEPPGLGESRRRAEMSLSARDSFTRPIVGYLVFRGALHALGYFLFLITIYHTFTGISSAGTGGSVGGGAEAPVDVVALVEEAIEGAQGDVFGMTSTYCAKG